MTITTRAAKGSALTHGELDGNFSPRNLYGVQDFQDTATATTPLVLAVADTWYDVPNDGLGPLSSQAFAIDGHGPVFNTSTGLFDFSDLELGDMLHIRADMFFETFSPNTSVAARLAFGPLFASHLSIGRSEFKLLASGEEGEFLRYFAFQIKSSDTQANPMKLQVKSDDAGTELTVSGWPVETTKLSI